jgi:LPPG:FO 2-phospho-L-lactate transferase
MILALAGGVGGARFLEGLIRLVPQRNLTVIGNVGDDEEVYGLHVSPDLDIVTYTLAEIVDPVKGWGIRNDTFTCQKALEQYGYGTWFNIGDRDLATQIYRTEQLRKGRSLSEVTADVAKRLGLKIRLLPATDDDFRTHVVSNGRQMHFQDYMVRLQTRPRVDRVLFHGSRSARPAKGVLRSIQQADGIIVCPSNPIVSIGAILTVPRIRRALCKARCRIVAISPIIGGKTIKGPADKLMRSLGVEPSVVGVAQVYRDFLDTLIIDRVDRDLEKRIEVLGIKVVITDTIMRSLTDKVRLARIALRELQ